MQADLLPLVDISVMVFSLWEIYEGLILGVIYMVSDFRFLKLLYGPISVNVHKNGLLSYACVHAPYTQSTTTRGTQHPDHKCLALCQQRTPPWQHHWMCAQCGRLCKVLFHVCLSHVQSSQWVQSYTMCMPVHMQTGENASTQ